MSFTITSTRSASRGGYIADLALLAVGGSALLIALILWFDNAQGGLTGNGVFKSLELKPWVVDPAHAPLYPANYLFYPVYGALCRGLDLLGVFAGDPRRQITILNALCAGLCLGAVYLMVRALTGDRRVALLAALFHVASSFVMFLAIVNEDIFPSYTLLFTAMALAAVWFARPTALRVVAVAALFSLAWLFEWRLMFPTLPAMLAALWFCEPRPARRLGWIALFLATMLAMAGLAAAAWQGHAGAVGPLDLLWTGKAVRSVWAGFTWPKVGYLWDGMVAYLLGAGVAALPGIPGWDIWRYTATVWMVAIAAVAGPMLWRARGEPWARALAAVFGVTFVAGSVFNLYSQPQDPQMQINVMPWLTVAWGLLVATVLAARRRPAVLLALAVLSLAPLVWNVGQLARWRGGDRAAVAALAALEKRFPPDSTVFVYWGFEPITMWQYALWSRTWDWDGKASVANAPSADPKFKWIAVDAGAIRHPDWTAEQHAQSIRRDIDLALDRGYRVVVSDIWSWSVDELAAQLGGLNAASRAPAIHRMLHDTYRAAPAFSDPTAGTYYELARR